MARDMKRVERVGRAVREAARQLGPVGVVPRVQSLDAAAFRALARGGCPFIVTDLVARWPISRLDRTALRERFGELQVVARRGDYVRHAFSSRRQDVPMTLRAFVDLPPHRAEDPGDLPAYVGNQRLEPLNALCEWPGYFTQWDPPRTWFGPAGTVTPLHCDYLENLFAQIDGRKRFVLVPPHEHALIGARAVDPVLWATGYNPEAPDVERFPRAAQAHACTCELGPGELLYLPAGWFHHVRALTDSLSINRWADDWPLNCPPDEAPAP